VQCQLIATIFGNTNRVTSETRGPVLTAIGVRAAQSQNDALRNVKDRYAF